MTQSLDRGSIEEPATPALPLVSVVTPVHNTAEYLADCIRSVLAQSYAAWEFIIVDNACTDGSRAIAESFAARDARIRIVQTDRLLPQVQNYNFALRQISSQARYCKMVQADDWIFPDCLKEMVAAAETDPEIAIIAAYQLGAGFVFGSGLDCPGPGTAATVVSGREACRQYFLRGRYTFGSPNSVLYRADLVRNRSPFFREVDSGYFEDAELCFDVLDKAKFAFIHQILTCARCNDDSITARVVGFDRGCQLMRYVVTKRYGPRYLSQGELRDCLARAEREYYRLLARHVTVGRKSGFWRWHARGLEQAGERIDWGRVVLLQFPRLLNALGNPKAALSGLFRRLVSVFQRPSPVSPKPSYY